MCSSTFSTAGHVDERPLNDARVETVPDLHRAHRLAEPRRELLVDPVLDQHAVRTHTGLPHVPVLRRDRAGNGRLEIGVVEDDEGGVPAELEAYLLDRPRALLHELLPDLGGAGEAELANDRARGHLAADLGPTCR